MFEVNLAQKKRILKLTAKLQAQPTQPKNALSSELVLVSLGWLGWGSLVWFGEQVPIGHELLPTLGVGTLVFLLMLGCVMAVVHHADQLADMLREPYGTLVLTLSAMVIEVSLMLRVMLQGAENPTL